jgi:hypothetical protein
MVGMQACASKPPLLSKARHDISFHLELGSTVMGPREVSDERLRLLKEQTNPKNKSEVNDTFRLHAHALRSAVILKKLNPSFCERWHY